MKYTGPTFRPPLEANTPLLQVTVGCAHNNCSFCTMYKDTLFTIEQIDQVEKDLREIRATYKSVERIFLINGDAFVLAARRLEEIAKLAIGILPELKTITMYASIRNIMDKSDEELIALRKLGINELWIGLETGNDVALKALNKGFTLSDAEIQLERIRKFDYDFNGIFMLGAAGKGKGIVNAMDTAKLINRYEPSLVGFTTLGIFSGSMLEKRAMKGEFEQATEGEVFEEERTLIENISVENIPFIGSHPINAANVTGILPQDREKLLAIIDEAVQELNDDILSSALKRSSL